MAKQVFPTKANLMATKKSLELANTGYSLLDKKRNVLIKEMMQMLDDVKVLREDITKSYDKAYKALEQANMSQGIINEMTDHILVDDGLNVKYRSVMGVELPKIDYHERQLGENYQFESANSQIDYAYLCFHEVKLLTVKLAQVENAVYRLAHAIGQTQKRANALKNISVPQLEETYKMISDALEEKEREEFSRQKVIKNQKH